MTRKQLLAENRQLKRKVNDAKKTGAIGGATRAKNLTAAKRKAIARKAARARWAKP